MDKKSEDRTEPRTSAPALVRHRNRKDPHNAEADAADLACAKRVLDSPDTEWVDWEDVKRELADKGD